MKLIVGLGNPGEKFDNTRHNIGFTVLDHLKHKLDLVDFANEPKFKGDVTKGRDIVLLKPQTFMNNSGQSVALLANFFKIAPEDVIVIHDELDLLLGKLKIRFGGGAGGHHGVESVVEHLGTPDFTRVRLGIGNAQAFLGEHKRVSFDANKFVMETFESGEKSSVNSMVKKAIIVLETIIKEGVEKAQNQYHQAF
jgi:PTH1 family peptidyl-tRNA hydrolase